MEERIINRVKKMLALANDLSASEGERDNALRMAYATMAKYNIDEAMVAAHGQAEARLDFESQSFSWSWAKSVNQVIAGLFFCNYYYGRKINGTQCIHHFVGKESNAMTAAVMADWIVKSILKEARALYKQNTSPESRSFALGAYNRLCGRIIELQSTEKTTAVPGTSLVLVDIRDREKQANSDFIKEAGVELTTGKARSSKVKLGAYEAGKQFGNSINLSPQVSGSTQGRLS